MSRPILHLLFLALGIAANIASAQPHEAAAAGVKSVTLHGFTGTDRENHRKPCPGDER